MPLTPAWALLLWRGHFLTTAWAFSGASYYWFNHYIMFSLITLSFVVVLFVNNIFVFFRIGRVELLYSVEYLEVF